MKKYTLSVGLNDKDQYTQLLAFEDAKNIIVEELSRQGLDCTVYRANGVYTHENGTTVSEETVRVDCYQFDNNSIFQKVVKSCARLKVLLNQESIAYEVQDVEGGLL